MRFLARSAMGVVVTLAVVSCGGNALGTTEPRYEVYQQTEADRACVDFYRSRQQGVVEAAVYLRDFADELQREGNLESADLIYDLTDEFEASQFGDPMDDEVGQTSRLARAGMMLAAQGAVRCADLGEVWGVGGYEGQPTAPELFDRQRRIWEGSGVRTYKLLVAKSERRSSYDTQIHVEVVDGEVKRILDAATGKAIGRSELPVTVTQVYGTFAGMPGSILTYDFVYAIPGNASLPDGTFLDIRLSESQFPEPFEGLS